MSTAGEEYELSEMWVSRRCDFKIAADFASEKIVDLAMPRHRGRLMSSSIYENRVAATFAQEQTTIPFKMTNQIKTLHSPETMSGSRMTCCP